MNVREDGEFGDGASMATETAAEGLDRVGGLREELRVLAAQQPKTEGRDAGSCPSCNGTGDLGGNPSYGMCPDCDGKGKLTAAIAVETKPVAWRYRGHFHGKPLPWQTTTEKWLADREAKNGDEVQPLYAEAPQPLLDAPRVIEAVQQALIWHEEQDKAISKQPNANTGDNGWRRMQHQEQIALLSSALQSDGEG